MCSSDLKKRGLMMRILGKIVSFFIRNPKLAFTTLRVGLTVLAMIGSAIAGYEASNNTDAFDGIFEKLGIDMDASNVGDADALADQMSHLEHLEKMNDQELGQRLNQAVADMGIDVDSHEFMTPDQAHDATLAPTDLMNDPAYADYQTAMEKIRIEKGDDTVRRLINLAKLDRALEEQHYKGMDVSAKASYVSSDLNRVTDVVGNDGEVTGVAKLDSNNNLTINSIEMKHNGVVVSKLQQVSYRVERDGEAAVGTVHRLRAALRQVDDGEPAVRQAYPPVGRVPVAAAVGPARRHAQVHAAQFPAVDRRGDAEVREDAGYATHGARS